VRRVATAALALLLTACGPGRVVRGGAINMDLLAAIRVGLTRVRGLAFTADVPARPMAPADIRGRLSRELDESFAPGDLDRVAAVETRLGLLPPGIALRPTYERLFESQIAAFYDPRAKDLGISTEALHAGGALIGFVSTITNRDFVGELLVSHELTHALQDQHWGLPTAPEPMLDSHGDRVLARRALLEGDATLTSFAYTRGGALDAGTVDAILGQMRTLPGELAKQYPDVPDAIRTPLVFQYDAGTAFTARAYLRGGWPAVDAAEADPPASSEQVLHPERYFDARDVPVDVAIGGTDRLEADGWRPVLEDTIGELGIRILVGGELSPATAVRVADGWGGDRLRAFTKGDALVLVWMTAWDRAEDATDFAGAMPVVRPDARIDQRDDRVLVLLGPESPASPMLAALASRVWQHTQVRRPS
jgi:hypothetical protein